MSDYLPKFTGPYTQTATAAVVGGRIVTAGGAVAGANATDFVGIASKDAKVGESYTVFSGPVERPQAAGPLAKSTLVKCAANGQVTTFVDGTDAVTRLVGVTLEAAANAGDKVAVHWFR
ncbi:DUF2190 family protein [Nocardioides sp. W3-2-3]|uniref:capsid cement protein n=1 Tax=Nocardioides convexus TaxID=2712224 RepID=UPI0024189F12|nr:capsid cement protein [Nocardioides convexus]NGZ99403.1 DUF2190 family protein [Nocardioides convexus]